MPNNKDFFLAGNIIRGVLAAFRCYGEGKKVAGFVVESLKLDEQKKNLNLLGRI